MSTNTVITARAISWRRPARIVALLILVACLLAVGRRQALGQEPAEGTRAWLVQHYLSVFQEFPDSVEKVRAAEWARVRDLPLTLRLLIDVWRDPAEPVGVRTNALLLAGATGQPAAYAFLARELSSRSRGDRFRPVLILALGSGDHPAVDRLAQEMDSPDPSDRMAAAFALGELQTPATDALLRSRLDREKNGLINATITHELAKPRRRR